ncbi:hypothetical protein V3481_019510 [Fusarium oxysporum f. sp. vasinfectum]|uniref:Uncharacterized protein n=1 Tax=Fusarium oxysporum f. sp. vasinfectum 25433 TaxID=1089449 RepID=X0L7A4_FUSOX|nr:hypothetical protein FOTG_14886 [Fusarium oxysporum f. sp. vasinfectum 25433]
MAGKRKTKAQLTLPKKKPVAPLQHNETTEDTRSDESSPLSELTKTPEWPSISGDDLQEDSHDSPDSVSTTGESEEFFIELLNQGSLQYINGHRVAGKSPRRYFELRCVLKDGTIHWISEATVQCFNNAAVCTYWHAREDKDGKPVARPYDEVDPHVLKIIEYQELKDQFWVQMVGDPIFHPGIIPSIEEWPKEPNSEILFRFKPTYMAGAEVREKWRPQYKTWDTSAKSQGQPDDLQMVFGHRKLCFRRKMGRKMCSQGLFEFSLLYFNMAPEGFFGESDVHSWNFVALMTYWHSNPELRTKESNETAVVPLMVAQIVRHRESEDGQLLFIFQKVGGSELEVDLEERDLKDMKKLGKKELNTYMEKNGLSAR